MNAIGKYRARADCRAGGLFRRAGDVFEMPMLDAVPGHLEEVGAQVGKATSEDPSLAKKPGRPASVPKNAQVGKADIGAASATSVQNVTSADMVKK